MVIGAYQFSFPQESYMLKKPITDPERRDTTSCRPLKCPSLANTSRRRRLFLSAAFCHLLPPGYQCHLQSLASPDLVPPCPWLGSLNSTSVKTTILITVDSVWNVNDIKLSQKKKKKMCGLEELPKDFGWTEEGLKGRYKISIITLAF